jgi:hypothetical protein
MRLPIIAAVLLLQISASFAAQPALAPIEDQPGLPRVLLIGDSVSIGYTLSQVLGSAFAPTIATALYTATKTSNSIVAYLIAVSVISAVAACFLPGSWARADAKVRDTPII